MQNCAGNERAGAWASPLQISDDPEQYAILQSPSIFATALVQPFAITAPNGWATYDNFATFRNLPIPDPVQLLQPFMQPINSVENRTEFPKPSTVLNNLLSQLTKFQNDLLGTP